MTRDADKSRYFGLMIFNNYLIYHLITNEFKKRFFNPERGGWQLCIMRISFTVKQKTDPVCMSFNAACSARQKETVVDYNTISDVNSCHHHNLSTQRSPGSQWPKIIWGLPTSNCRDLTDHQSSTKTGVKITDFKSSQVYYMHTYFIRSSSRGFSEWNLHNTIKT